MYRIRIDGENHRQRVSQARMKCGPACQRIGGLGGKFSAYQASEEPELISLAAVHASFCDTCVLAITQEHVVLSGRHVNDVSHLSGLKLPSPGLRLLSCHFYGEAVWAALVSCGCSDSGASSLRQRRTTTRCGRDTMGILSVEQTASIRFRSSVPNDQVAKHGENVIEFH
ncbi:hypothetical protein R3P38DRAFT_3346742 [Favolaschia claudopus]|uniref:Uncharacterized protein n=1 Tax=Favolaschia claudopus TaxID=2862362 RepID=A0AAW0CZE5_9AGAR